MLSTSTEAIFRQSTLSTRLRNENPPFLWTGIPLVPAGACVGWDPKYIFWKTKWTFGDSEKKERNFETEKQKKTEKLLFLIFKNIKTEMV